VSGDSARVHHRGDPVYDAAAGHLPKDRSLRIRRGDSVGFCPVGFYVPDWWDLHDGTQLFPGSLSWHPRDHEWPVGDFGFVWGCVWGDDSSWKVQYLDLSGVRGGVIRRDDRFGYLRLATDPKLDMRDFIRCSSWEGQRRVEFYVESHYDIESGQRIPDEDV
jgi:hypothetical protein